MRTLEERIEQLEVDNKLVWECLWGNERNLFILYMAMRKELGDAVSWLNEIEAESLPRADYERNIRDIQKSFYERLEDTLYKKKGHYNNYTI